MPAAMVGASILEKHCKSEANEAVLHELRVRKGAGTRKTTTTAIPMLAQQNAHHFPGDGPMDHPRGPRLDGVSSAAGAAEIERLNGCRTGAGAGLKRRQGAADWCISRQRSWGVPIPAFYDAHGQAILDARVVRNAADLFEKHGSNIWFEQPAAELWRRSSRRDGRARTASKSTDTLDVWI